MRFESATVPAAVMPDRSNDDGFVKYLPLFRFTGMGRLHKSGISQKTCQRNLIFKAFGKKSTGSVIDSHLIFLVSAGYLIYGLIINNCKHISEKCIVLFTEIEIAI
jgi:hypothetical protein